MAGALLLGLALWLLGSLDQRTYRTPVDRLTVGTVTRAPFEDFVAVRATAAPLTTHYVTAEEGGTVKQILAEDGASVKAGQPLIVLDNAALQLEVGTREAQTASQINALQDTRLQLEQMRFKHQQDLLDIDHKLSELKSDLARDKILLDGKAIAPATYHQEQEDYAYQENLRQATVDSWKVQQQVRNEQLEQLARTLRRLKDNSASAEASLDALTIRAPAGGQLTALDAQIGQSKAQGAVLGEIDSPERFKLTAQVDEFYVGRVVTRQMALLTIDDRNYQVTVSKLYPQITNGTFKVDLQFAGTAPPGLRTGQALDIKLELGRASKALLLPNGPFYQDTGGRWVFVVTPDGKSALRRSVRLGRRNPQYVEVVDGLAAGERVVISGYQALQNIDRIELAGTI